MHFPRIRLLVGEVKSMKRNLPWLAAISFLCGCNAKPSTRLEQPIKEQTADTSLPDIGTGHSKSASPEEVDATLQRIFGRLVIANRADHSSVTGDFNGDGSLDLAVIVLSVKTELGMINGELANWTIQDADQFFTPPAGERVVFQQKQSRLSVEAGEPLLAVIHGFGKAGWRDSAARQAYLIRHAALGDLRAIRATGHIERAPPTVRNSDVIYEGSNHGEFLFWNGSQYAWNRKANNKP